MPTHMSALLPSVLPYVPNCPEFLAIAQIKAAAIQYCERTRCWRAVVSQVLTAQGQAIIAPLPSATIHLFEDATLDGQPLLPMQFTDIEPDEMNGEVATGTPQYITQIEPGKVQVYPFLAGATLRASVFLKPRADALYNTIPTDPFHDAYAVIPDFLSQQDGEAIASGAIYRLKIMPEQRFYDPQGAGVAMQSFERACDSRFGGQMKGQQRAKIRTKPHWF